MYLCYDLDKKDMFEKIREQVLQNSVILYMKGTPEIPQCGFSQHAVLALQSCCKCFAFVNILEYPEIRSVLPKFSYWPTFPQLFVDSKLIGGCDVILDFRLSGELHKIIGDIGGM